MEKEIQLACNRTPFQGDSVCDRGEVDIGAFLDFPICKLIDPPEPETATPQVDFPVFPFTPPACACHDIEVVAKNLSIEGREDLYVNVEFKSIGDCCEGNYEADLDIRVPCIPFSIKQKGESSAGGVAIKIGCEDSGPTGKFAIYMGVDSSDSCAISIEPHLEIGLPCIPFEIEGGDEPKDIKITADCEEQEPSGTFNLGLEVDCCTISFNPQLELKIPKPKDVVFTMDVDMNIDCYGSSTSESPGASCEVITRKEDCQQIIETALNLRIPCIPFEFDNKDATVEIKSDCKTTKPTGKFDLGLKTDCCTISLEPKLSLEIPKPKEIEFAMDVQMEELACNSATGSFSDSPGASCEIIVKEEDCTKTFQANLNIRLPHVSNISMCENAEIDIGGDLGGSGEFDMGAQRDACGFITGMCPKISLNLPCPISGEDIKLDATINWGPKQKDTTTLATVSADSCSLTCKKGNIDLQLPCPLDELNLVGLYPVQCEKVESTTCGAVWVISIAGEPDPSGGGQSGQSSGSASRSPKPHESSGGGSGHWSGGSGHWSGESISGGGSGSVPPGPGPSGGGSGHWSGGSISGGSGGSGEICTYIEYEIEEAKDTEYIHITQSGQSRGRIYYHETSPQILTGYSIEATKSEEGCCIVPATIEPLSDLGISVQTTIVEHCKGSYDVGKLATVDILCDTSQITPKKWATLCGKTLKIAAPRFLTTCDSSPVASSVGSGTPSGGSGGGGPSGTPSGGSGGGGPSGGSGGSGSGGGNTFVAVTNVACSSHGGIEITTTTFTIDFDNKTVTSKVNPPGGGDGTDEGAAIARELLMATVKAIKDDPAILSIVDNPDSIAAKRSLAKLGLGDTDFNTMQHDDDRIYTF